MGLLYVFIRNMNILSSIVYLVGIWIRSYWFDYYFVVDGLVKKLDELEKVVDIYRGLIDYIKKLLKVIFEFF